MRIFSGAARTWALLALRSDHGRVQVQNLIYDYKKRPEAKATIDELFVFLRRDYDFVLGADPTFDAVMEISCVGAIAEFARTRLDHVGTMCPKIPADAFDKKTDGDTICRVTRFTSAVRHYALHSNYCCLVDRRPTINNPAAAVSGMISELGLSASAGYRGLLATARGTTASANWAAFYSFQSSLRPKPKRHRSSSEATWVCYQLGLLEEADGESMIKIIFQLSASDTDYAYRPTTIASMGYAAFCANDQRDKFGRTQRLDVGKIMGLPEFIMSCVDQPVVVSSEDIGSPNPGTTGSVRADLIISHLRKRAR